MEERLSIQQLPRAQRAVWSAVASHVRQEGRLPRLSELRRELGVTPQTVAQHLRALATKGLVTVQSQGHGRPPLLALTDLGRALAGLGVPVVGTIRGGPLGEAVFEPLGHLNVKARPGWFALRVVGDSMADLILDGDLVLLEPNVEPRPGETCAVRVNGDQATLKRLYPDLARGMARLEPNNPAHPTREVPLAEVLVDGVYRALFRSDWTASLTGVNTV